MRPGFLSSVIYWVCKVIGVASLCLILVVGIVGLNVNPSQNVGPLLVKCHVWIIANAKWLIPGLTVVFGFCKAVIKWTGSPAYWEIVRKILDYIQHQVFQNVSPDEFSEDHRVTLYQYKDFTLFPGWRDWLWPWGFGNHPWSGWMIPLVRSGTMKKSKTVFLAHANEGGKFEGIAGATMLFQHKVLERKNLPDVSGAAKQEDIDEYAKQTFVSTDWLTNRISKQRLCSRSFIQFAFR